MIPILALGIITTILCVFLKESKSPVFAILLAVIAGCVILLKMIPSIGQVVSVFQQLANEANLNTLYLSILLKIIAISYIAEFVGQICKDAGQSSIAMKIDLAAKVLVMVLATPVLLSVLESVLKILP